MRYKKSLVFTALIICLTACSKKTVSDTTDGANYRDADGNPITFSETVGKGYETSIADVLEIGKADNEVSTVTSLASTEVNGNDKDNTDISTILTLSEGTQTDITETIPAIDKETDRQIRSDYAIYVSERDNRQVNADDVAGIYNYGMENGYRLLVMCPSESFTEDIQEIRLPYMDLPDDDCDCFPYLLITLPSGTYEMVVYKDNTFTDIVTAVNEKLISYDAVVKIEGYMNLYYTEGNQMCVYKIET